eukprot:3272015-Karenia_brevis.AAC.1
MMSPMMAHMVPCPQTPSKVQTMCIDMSPGRLPSQPLHAPSIMQQLQAGSVSSAYAQYNAEAKHAQ